MLDIKSRCTCRELNLYRKTGNCQNIMISIVALLDIYRLLDIYKLQVLLSVVIYVHISNIDKN